MAERIFISYRREDSRGYAGRLQGDLSRRYTSEAVFRDIEIPPGVDFAQHINMLIDHCNVVLVMIGNGWSDARDSKGARRLDKDEDWVRLEIERALARSNVEVIPVLVDGAKLPPREELPPTLAPLRRLNAFELSDRRWDYDVNELGRYLDAALKGTSAMHPQPVPPPPAPAPAPAPSRTDHHGAVLAAAGAALLTAFPADLIARNSVHRQPLSSDDLSTVSDFALQKGIFYGIIAAVAALVVGLLSRRSRDPIVSLVLGLGAGVLAGAVYAGAYSLGYLSADTSKTSSAAIGLIAAGAFLGWAFAADRPGSRLEASCAGLAGGLLAAALLGALHSSYTSSSGNQRVIQALAVAIIVAVATFVGLRLPRESSAELLTPARAAPPAMNR
ncbi:MAG TPA: toll/interleukin-1 receptor domain-containing protein [Solirubrobacteraceae bacterium]